MALSEEDKLWFAGRIDSLAERVDGRIDSLSGRLDVLTDRADGLTARVDGISERIDGLTARVDGLSERVDSLSERVDGQSKDMEGMTRSVLDLRTEIIRRFEADARLPSMSKALIAFGTMAGQLTSEQWRAKDVTAVLTDRLARLEEQVSKLMKPAA